MSKGTTEVDEEYDENISQHYIIYDLGALIPIQEFEHSKQFFVTPKKVPKLLINSIICILSECIHELSILKATNLQNDLGPNANNLPTYMSLEERYMGQENHADYRINATNSDFDKLSRDIHMLYVVLNETCKELKLNSYQSIQEVVEIFNKMHKDEEELLESEARQTAIIENLKRQYDDEMRENIQTIEQTDSKIQTLRFEVEDINIYGDHEVQYFNKWEQARVEQNYLKCMDKENVYGKIIEDTTLKIRDEIICHDALMVYFEEIKTDYMEEIEKWMKTYDDETEQKEMDIITIKADLEKMSEERKKMTELYQKKQADMEDWLEYKRIKQELEAQRKKELQAALKIQAWWRGVMVRKHLGPYRKKQKGKRKGKDKGKRRKKK